MHEILSLCVCVYIISPCPLISRWFGSANALLMNNKYQLLWYYWFWSVFVKKLLFSVVQQHLGPDPLGATQSRTLKLQDLNPGLGTPGGPSVEKSSGSPEKWKTDSLWLDIKISHFWSNPKCDNARISSPWVLMKSFMSLRSWTYFRNMDYKCAKKQWYLEVAVF